MKRKVSVGACVAITIIAVALSVSITTMTLVANYSFGNDTTGTKIISRIKEIDNQINANFYSLNQPATTTQLVDGAAQGYVTALGDKYSTYYTKEQYEAIVRANTGKSVGIGVTLVQNSAGLPQIIRVDPSSPAQTAGVKSGDIITGVGNQTTTDLGFNGTIAAMQGNVNTKCDFSVSRDNSSLINFSIVRSEFDEQSVITKKIGNIEIIQILTFNSGTVSQFKAALDQATQEKSTGLIFDLRNNGGGTLDSAEKIINLVCPSGIIGSIDYNNGKHENMPMSDENHVNLPIVCLINENTASAAELFTADMRDFNVATLVGTNTYGKGIMQNTYELSDGTAVRLTVAKFNPHSGKNFQGVGIAPDVVIPITPAQEQKIYMLDQATDPQLSESLNILNGDISTATSNASSSSKISTNSTASQSLSSTSSTATSK